MLRLAAALPLVWLGCFTPADDVKPPAPTPQEAATPVPEAPPPAGPTAEQILDKVVERQGSKALPETIDDCRGELQVTVSSEGKRLEGEILQIYQRNASGDRLRTEYTDMMDKKEKTIRVANGSKFRGAHGNEPAVDFNSRDFERDVKEIKEDLATLKLILKVFALRSPTATGTVKWTRLADQDGNGLHSFVLERTEPLERTVRLYVSRDDYRLLGVELPPSDIDKRKQSFCLYEADPNNQGAPVVLDSVTVGGHKISGLHLPRLVKLFIDDAPKESSTVFIKSISLNGGVSADLFTLR
ncbi:MAG: hypothetical protein HYR85_26670 [Planctomycetes bacterium]|nr:hypothetical protein [Planctomycetota bacterium]MBI3847923.1 hypothetical protein [Planctomycetota bacterium]